MLHDNILVRHNKHFAFTSNQDSAIRRPRDKLAFCHARLPFVAFFEHLALNKTQFQPALRVEADEIFLHSQVTYEAEARPDIRTVECYHQHKTPFRDGDSTSISSCDQQLLPLISVRLPQSVTMGFAGTLISCAVFLAVIGVSIWLSIYYLGDRNSLPDQLPDLNKYLPDLDLFHKEDPFSKVNESEANRWPNDGSGLDMQLVNCLDSFWYDYFDQAVQDWDNGSPDALTLSTEVGTPESECSAVDGIIKVCNGDYGETDWKGASVVSFFDHSGSCN
jgi:hypothetical protein